LPPGIIYFLFVSDFFPVFCIFCGTQIFTFNPFSRVWPHNGRFFQGTFFLSAAGSLIS